MTNKLIKVDRVRSVEEATTLESLGAGLVGVSLEPDPRFDDDRAIAVEQAADIRKELRRAELVVAMDLNDNPDRILRLASMIRTDLVQPISGTIPPREVRKRLADGRIGIVYAGIEISHDDDPGWVFGNYDDVTELNAAYFQADVLPEYRTSWTFLRDRSPEFPDEIQIGDLNELAAQRPLLVALDFSRDQIGEITAALPNIRGLAFTIGDQPRRGDVRFHSYDSVLGALA